MSCMICGSIIAADSYVSAGIFDSSIKRQNVHTGGRKTFPAYLLFH